MLSFINEGRNMLREPSLKKHCLKSKESENDPVSKKHKKESKDILSKDIKSDALDFKTMSFECLLTVAKRDPVEIVEHFSQIEQTRRLNEIEACYLQVVRNKFEKFQLSDIPKDLSELDQKYFLKLLAVYSVYDRLGPILMLISFAQSNAEDSSKVTVSFQFRKIA